MTGRLPHKVIGFCHCNVHGSLVAKLEGMNNSSLPSLNKEPLLRMNSDRLETVESIELERATGGGMWGAISNRIAGEPPPPGVADSRCLLSCAILY